MKGDGFRVSHGRHDHARARVVKESVEMSPMGYKTKGQPPYEH